MPDLGELPSSLLLELSAQKLSAFTIGSGRTSTNPVVLKKFQITQDPSTPKQRVRWHHGSLNCQIKRDSGSSDVECGFYTSTDGVDYDDKFLRVQTSGSSFARLDSGSSNFFIDDDRLFWIIGALANDGSTTGTVRNASCSMVFQIPPGYTVKRIA